MHLHSHTATSTHFHTSTYILSPHSHKHTYSHTSTYVLTHSGTRALKQLKSTFPSPSSPKGFIFTRTKQSTHYLQYFIVFIFVLSLCVWERIPVGWDRIVSLAIRRGTAITLSRRALMQASHGFTSYGWLVAASRTSDWQVAGEKTKSCQSGGSWEKEGRGVELRSKYHAF